MAAFSQSYANPTDEYVHAGFRIAGVPEPSTIALLGMGAFGLIAYVWRRGIPRRVVGCLIALVILSADVAPAVTIDLVPVGNIGNAADPSTNFGSVGYAFSIGKYDVTAGQYAEFLTAVASASDPYGLYCTDMATTTYGSTITKSGGVYTAASPTQPVVDVSWGDAARFCNWLHNGQPMGILTGNPVQDAGLTEDGAYGMNGATNDAALMAVGSHKADAKYWIPTNNEWYKAAYYDPNKPGGAGYWFYPTKSNASNPPSNVLDPAGKNNANFFDLDGTGNHRHTLNPANTTPVGAFADSPSPYGTFDQGGNVHQWTEDISSSKRVLRGGSFGAPLEFLASSTRFICNPTWEANGIGFRVASVPEPSTLALLLSATLGGLLWWRRRS
jgi:formylglycine-generating enzyme